MTDLHARLLEELDKPYEIWSSTNVADQHGRHRLALRALVELHAPHDFVPGSDLKECHGCDPGAYAEDRPDWPCTTVKTIARELGVEP